MTQHRYVAGNEGLVASAAPLRRGRSQNNAYANGKPLPSVAETMAGAAPTHQLAGSGNPLGGGSYETFGGEEEEDDGGLYFNELRDGDSSVSDDPESFDRGLGPRAGNYGVAGQPADVLAGVPPGGPVGGLRGGGAGEEEAKGSKERWKGQAVDFSEESAATLGDSYYEGFGRSEVEEDSEEMKRRGGQGYRPFFAGVRENDGYDMAEHMMGGDGGRGGDATESAIRALEESDGDSDTSFLDDDPPPRGVLDGRRGGAGGRGGGMGRSGEDSGEFARVGMLRKDGPLSAKGKEDVQRIGGPGMRAGGALSTGVKVVSDDDNDDDSSFTSSDNDVRTNDYTGFDTASTSSSVFAGKRFCFILVLPPPSKKISPLVSVKWTTRMVFRVFPHLRYTHIYI